MTAFSRLEMLREFMLVALAWALVALWRLEAWPVAVLVTVRPLVVVAWRSRAAQRGRKRASASFTDRFPRDPDHYL